MKLFKKFNIKKLDIVILALSVLLAFAIIPTGISENNKKLMLFINNSKYEIPWGNDLINMKSKYNKDMLIEINNKKARILESNCPDKICVFSSWISECGQISACLPNNVMITVECDGK